MSASEKNKSSFVLLQGGRVLNPATQQDSVCDVLIQDGKIAAMGTHLPVPPGAEVLTLSPDFWVTPGLVDIHVHFRDPGNPEKETTASGAQAAIAGGFTSIGLMPNTQPRLDDLTTLDYVLATARRETPLQLFPICAASKGLKGEEMTELGLLADHGAVGFTDDGYGVDNAGLMRRILTYCAMIGKPFMCHAEDSTLSAHGCMHEGYYSTLLGLGGIPAESESVMVSRDIELLRGIPNAHVHFTHISSKQTIDLIRQAKKEGLRVTGDTAPHYLTLTDAAVQQYDADFKMNPPLRSQADQDALIEGLLDGTLDAIATDHAPHTPDEKRLPFDQAPNGVIGLETSLGVMLTHFVHTGKLTPLQLVALMSHQPAQCFGLPAGQLAVGQRADVTVIHPNYQWTVDPSQFASKARNCPFKGQLLTGKAWHVFASGQHVLRAGQLQREVAV